MSHGLHNADWAAVEDIRFENIRVDHRPSLPIEVSFGHADWRVYQTLPVPAGQTVTHAFPEGRAAQWVRAVADRPCPATATFPYE